MIYCLYVCCKVIHFELKCKVFVESGEFFFYRNVEVEATN